MPNKKHPPGSFAGFLSDQGRVGHLARMLEQQQHLLAKIQHILPPPVNEHCRHARIDRRQLILFTDSPVWKARLRFLAPVLLRELAPVAPHLAGVRIRIIPGNDPTPRPVSRQPRLTREAASHLFAAAEHIGHPQLRDALLRLGHHATPRTDDRESRSPRSFAVPGNSRHQS